MSNLLRDKIKQFFTTLESIGYVVAAFAHPSSHLKIVNDGVKLAHILGRKAFADER